MSPHIMVLGSLYACALEYFNYTSNKSASGVSIPVKAQPGLNYPFGSSLLAACIAFGSSLLQVSGSQLLSCMRFACQAAEKNKTFVQAFWEVCEGSGSPSLPAFCKKLCKCLLPEYS